VSHGPAAAAGAAGTALFVEVGAVEAGAVEVLSVEDWLAAARPTLDVSRITAHRRGV
jgi:hypothetical protein